MTRPAKKDGDKKTLRITVRFDSPEYAKVCAEAKAAGVTVSKLIREKTMRGYVRVPKYAKVDTSAINQIPKIGGS